MLFLTRLKSAVSKAEAALETEGKRPRDVVPRGITQASVDFGSNRRKIAGQDGFPQIRVKVDAANSSSEDVR